MSKTVKAIVIVTIVVVGTLGAYFLLKEPSGVSTPSGFTQTNQYSQGGYTYTSYSGTGTTQGALGTFRTRMQNQGWIYKTEGALGEYSGDLYEKGDLIAIVSATQVGKGQVEVIVIIGAKSGGEEPSPAVFEVSDLIVNPSEVKLGETVTISVVVTNVGGSWGEYTVNLMIEGGQAGSESVSLSSGESRTVSFVVNKSESKTYTAEVGSLSQTFRVNPVVELTIDITVSTSVSSTLLYSLSQDMLNSIDTPLVTVDLSNGGEATAKDVSVKAKVSGYGEYYSVYVGDIAGRSSAGVEITPKASSEIMNLTSDVYRMVQVKVEYYDEDGVLRTREISEEILIKGRNSFSHWWSFPELVSAWVTPTDESVRGFATEATRGVGATTNDSGALEAAERIFKEMEAYGIDYITDAHTSGDYVQFPVQTLKNKSGDCDDLAVLYSALLESVGIRTKLILIPGHVFTGLVLPSGTFKPIESTMVGNFDGALSYGASEYQSYLEKGEIEAEIDPTLQHALGVKPVDITMSVPLPDIDVNISDPNYWWELIGGCRATVTVTFTNNGNASGMRGITIYAIDEYGNIEEILGEDTYILELTQIVNANSSWSREITFDTEGKGWLGYEPSEEIEVYYSIVQ